jgi:hypothetical protein
MPISPNQGKTGGGTVVTITGTNLSGTTAVKFGGSSVSPNSVTPTQVTASSPAGAGTVQVSLTTPAGSSNGLPFYYIPGPVISSISPTAGPTAGGNAVTITGINLATATAVNFGASSATPTVVSDSTINVTVPAGAAAGTVAFSVVTAGGTSASLSYTYVDSPAITTISPSSGPTSGGSAVTITGTDLGQTNGVLFDGATANFLVISSTEVVALTPAGTAGQVDVVVSTAGGTATANNGYQYISGPGI